MLSVIFLVLSLFFGALMFLWAYGRGWTPGRCIAFAVGMAVLLCGGLFLCKALLLKIVHAVAAALPGWKDAVVGKVKALL